MVMKNRKNLSEKKKKPKKGIPNDFDLPFITELQEKGLTVIRMASDGNCMFRSIAHQLFADANLHLEVRKKILDYIEQEKDHFVLFLDEEEESFDDYIKRLRCFGEWGDNTELYAAAQCYQVDIYIHQADTPMYMISGSSSNSSSGSGKCIHLSYHGECHYNSVLPTNQQQTTCHIGNNEKIVDTTKNNDISSHKPSQQEIDIVAGAVPWVEDECIRQALEKTVGNIDEAIELLCSGFMELEVSTDKNNVVADGDSTQLKVNANKVNTKNQDEQDKRQDPSQDEQSKKDHKHSKGSKAKKNVVLSKKQQRKLEKQSLATKDSKDIPPIVDIHSPSPSFQNVIVI